MKTLTITLLLVATVILISCEGPMGPPGAPGQDGDLLLGTVFEMQGDFRASNNYELFFDFPQDFEIYDTDVVLVYILWEVLDVNGKQTDLWRLLPQTVILDDGLLQYNFDYTVADVKMFLEGSTDFNNLLPAETDNQVFRIAVMPADFIAIKSIDINDFNSLMTLPDIRLNSIEKLEIDQALKRR
jgi:hypothetical protein